jgi:hypothetical protein
MEPWTGAQRAFAVKAFHKNGDSFVIAQREFRIEFGIHRNRAVPLAHAIKIWVRNFEALSPTSTTVLCNLVHNFFWYSHFAWRWVDVRKPKHIALKLYNSPT